MKTSAITALVTALIGLAQAAPMVEKRQFQAQITFEGAPPDDASFTLSVPTDGSVFGIKANPLSVSQISSLGGASCSFVGIDGSHTVVVGAQTVDVGPPQAQISGSCLAF
ncbi:hypothetical protein G7Y89_g5879 [Cudoniella acicularis]|uniref:Uncharacterized protein n=1 Tax=Cudoniella acicularis TaxID=354080 RepID=A0A8H4RME0_9HELO|nr:hypothetical protein G7Y89_g5879 [Cudoniella acicularis]